MTLFMCEPLKRVGLNVLQNASLNLEFLWLLVFVKLFEDETYKIYRPEAVKMSNDFKNSLQEVFVDGACASKGLQGLSASVTYIVAFI